MDDRGRLVRAITAARTGAEQAAAVAALDSHDRISAQAAAMDRELDLTAAAVRQTLGPVPLFEHHTAATDWLGDYEPPSDYRTAMIAEASAWYRGVPPEVRHDAEEFAEQARLRAYTAASRYGDGALAARREFLSVISYLNKGAASGLPQIDQVIDPDNQPSPTPYPEEVFDNFAPEENEYNGIETPNHNSGISSQQAPLLQQVEQQNGSGSGFGSGPEKPDEHSTGDDFSGGYAEVPLGPPGVIPTSRPGPMPGAAATPPNPVTGRPEDDDQMGGHSASLTLPDHEGYRWHTAQRFPLGAPLHVRCGSLHWPGGRCGAPGEHVAVSYASTIDELRQEEQSQRAGFREGAALFGTGPIARVAAHHNALLGAFTAAERTADEISWLHGYLAAVRPMLASQQVTANKYIKQRGNKWVILQKGSGDILSTHDSQAKAEAAFRGMEMHMHEGSAARPNFP